MSKRILYNITTSTSSSFQAQNVSSGTLNLSTGLTSASAQITNLNATTATVSTLLNTNAVSTNVSSGTLNLSTGLTAASAQITNENVTTSTIATLRNTNAVSTNISSATLNLSTGLTAASAQITNENVTTSTIATLRNTNTISTNITSTNIIATSSITNGGYDFVLGTTDQVSRGNSGLSRALVKFNGNNLFLNFDNDFSGGTNVFGKLTVNNGYGLSGPDDFNVTGTGRITTSLTTGALYSTNLTSTNVVATNISSGTISATTFTGGSLSLSGNLNVAGTLTTVNITSTNLVNTNVSAGVVVASTSLSATGSSNTIGNIFTNSGQVGINTTTLSDTLTIRGGLSINRDTASNTTGAFRILQDGTGAVGGAPIINYIQSGTQQAVDSRADMRFTSMYNGIAYMTIATTGNVGIGTTSPVGTLEVRDTTNFVGDDGGVLYITGGTNGNRRLHMGYVNTANYGWIESVEKGNNLTNLSLQPRGGNVGIGTTSPSGKLHIKDTGSVTLLLEADSDNVTESDVATLQFSQDGGLLGMNIGLDAVNSNYIKYNAGSLKDTMFHIYNDTTTVLTLTSAGNVGINTTAPTFALDVNGIITSRNYILVQSTATVASYYVNDNSMLGWSFGLDTDTSFKIKGGQPGGNQFTNNAFAPTRFTINTVGNVGIGTTSPAYTLDVNGPTRINTTRGVLIGSSTDIDANRLISALDSGMPGNADRYICIGKAASTNNQAELSFFNVTTGSSSNYLGLGLHGARTMAINGAGNVGIGNTGSVTGLSIERSGASSSILHVYNPSSTTPGGINVYYNGVSGGSGGNFIRCNDFNSNRMFVLGSGNLQNANNSYGGISDIKLKENIVDATPKLEELMQVQIRNYNLLNETTKQIGVVAQELEPIFPSLVEEISDMDNDGNDLGTKTKAVKYSVFIPILIKALQELKQEFDDYKQLHP